MVNYSCPTCGKIFKQKGHFMKHLQKKNPCDNINDKIEKIVENKVDELVQEKLQEILENKKFISNKDSDIENTDMKDKKIKFIDLFCGLGAFHTSFLKSEKDYECVFACDINENVRRIYEENHGIKTHGDINKIDINNDIPDFDILCAGFPCQPFSIAGNKEGFNDKEKGNLFYNILDIVDVKKPNTLILENVKNLLTINGGGTFNIIQEELYKRGYNVSYKIIDSKYYNSPQSRQRLLIICSKTKKYNFKDIKNAIIPVSSIIDTDENDVLDYDLKYNLNENKCSNRKNTCNMIFKLTNKKSGKGGRQGERVYSPDSCGPTICASSGGPGAKTGLYYIDGKVRRLNVGETLQMFGFSKDYKWKGIVNKEEMLFCLGNSIVVNVIDEIIKDL